MTFQIVTAAEILAGASKLGRDFMRLGALMGLAVENRVEYQDVFEAMKAGGYPEEAIPHELVIELSLRLGKRLLDAGVLAPDEDPLDRIFK